MISLQVEIPEWLHQAIQQRLAQDPTLDQDAVIVAALSSYLVFFKARNHETAC